MPAPPEPSVTPRTRISLASAALPRPVREALLDLLALVSQDVVGRLEQVLSDLERHLFQLAERATRPAVQLQHLTQLRAVQRNRDHLARRFVELLEADLADLRAPALPVIPTTGAIPRAPAWELRLLEDEEAGEDALLRSISMRTEARAGLQLQLLGQRFGVLAGKPAFSAQTLPTGPYRLATLLGEASAVLEIGPDTRLTLLQLFDRIVLSEAETLLEVMNTTLALRNVLPSMAYVPLRTRPRAQGGTEAPAAAPAAPAPAPAGVQTWGEASGSFDFTRQMLGRRRGLISRLRTGNAGPQGAAAVSTQELFEALGPLQARPVASISQVRDALRQQLGPERAGMIAEEDADVLELVGLLIARLLRDVRADSPSATWLERLHVALVRLALVDHRFFEFAQHPARRVLDAASEVGEHGFGDEDLDPQLRATIEQAVEEIVAQYNGDLAVFESAQHAIHEQLQGVARRSEVSERRQVESARGKERLAHARRRAADVIEKETRERALPRVIRSIVTQAWADVLTLTLLRHDEGSEEWARQLETTRQIVAVSEGGPVPAGLGARICEALTLIGYHVEEAASIGRHLSAGRDTDDDMAASRTELAMRLKSRTRLGAQAMPDGPPPAPRSLMEQHYLDTLLAMRTGRVFEFSVDADTTARHRLAWIGPATGSALFVNRRGQRAQEYTLDELARLMARGEARLVEEDARGLVERAWQATLDSLRTFGSQAQGEGGRDE